MKKETTTQYIDIWESISKTTKRFTPLEVFALIATKSYGHSLRQVSKILKITPTEVKKAIAKLERAIRKDLKDKGANLKRLTNVHGVDHILELEEEDSRNKLDEY